MKNKTTNTLKYFYLFLLLCFSGNPFFTHQRENNLSNYFIVITTVILAIIYYREFEIPESKHLYIFITFFTIIFSFQYFILGTIAVPGALGFIVKITMGYIIIAIIGSDFKRIYLYTIYYISIVSLLGFSLNLLGVEFPSLFTVRGEARSIIFYTEVIGFNEGRNAGMFWEPGAFACYIILGFSFFIGNIKILIKEYKPQVFVILLALITTFSTTGFIVLFVIILYTLYKEYFKKNFINSLPLILFFIFIGYQVYLNAEFLNEKINNQYDAAMERDGDFAPDRMSALLFDLQLIKKHPLFGNGMAEETLYADHPELIAKELGKGNGFSNFLATMGILSLLFYIYYVLRYKTSHKLIFIIIILLLLQGQTLLEYPMFLALPFIYIFNKTDMNVIIKIRKSNKRVLFDL